MLSESNTHWLVQHTRLLLDSYCHFFGKALIPSQGATLDMAEQLFQAPFVVLSHNGGQDPIFNYGNQTALDLFAMSWPDLTSMPSRYSAEHEEREARALLLERARTQGYINDYSGVRISSQGQRFRIKNAEIWNLVDEQGISHGQGTRFASWEDL